MTNQNRSQRWVLKEGSDHTIVILSGHARIVNQNQTFTINGMINPYELDAIISEIFRTKRAHDYQSLVETLADIPNQCPGVTCSAAPTTQNDLDLIERANHCESIAQFGYGEDYEQIPTQVTIGENWQPILENAAKQIQPFILPTHPNHYSNVPMEQLKQIVERVSHIADHYQRASWEIETINYETKLLGDIAKQ